MDWISTLLRTGLLNGSFIPEKRIREFRHLNRYRKSIIRDTTSQKNRIEKFLQSSGFRLSSFISDIFGASGRNILLHLIEHGQIDLAQIEASLAEEMAPFALQVEQLISIYGINTTASCAIFARKLLVIIYTMLKQGTLFDESCFETRRKNCEQKQLSRYIRELEKHGYHVEAKR